MICSDSEDCRRHRREVAISGDGNTVELASPMHAAVTEFTSSPLVLMESGNKKEGNGWEKSATWCKHLRGYFCQPLL